MVHDADPGRLDPASGPLPAEAYQVAAVWRRILAERRRTLLREGLPAFERIGPPGSIGMRLGLDILAPAAALWTFCNEYEHWGLVSTARFQRMGSGMDTDNPWGAGSLRSITVAPGVAYRERILEADPTRVIRYTFEAGAPIAQHRGEYHFEPIDQASTRYTFTMSFRPTFPLSVVRGPFGAVLRRENAVAMALLARYSSEDPWFFRRIRFLRTAGGNH